MRQLSIFLFLLAQMVSCAAPVLILEISGVARSSGETFRLVEGGMTRVSDPVDFTFEDTPGEITVSFPNVAPGDYFRQISFDREVWQELPGMSVHPVAGTLSFVHDPGNVVSVSYRLVNFLESCAVVTIRNTGDEALTGIAAGLTGVGFTLDTSAMAMSLNPGESTTVTACYTGIDLLERLASMQVTSNVGPVTLNFVGDNDPGAIQQAPNYRLLGNTWDHPGAERLCFVDTTTGAATPVSSTRIEKIMGIAWDQDRQVLYGTTTHLSSPESRLVKIDPMSGATIADYNLGLGGEGQVAEGDVAVQPSTGLVFCLISGGSIRVWNPVSEIVESSLPLVDPRGGNDFSGLAFNQAGELYVVNPNSLVVDPTQISMLHRIDPLTGGILNSIELSEDLGVVMGLAFHPETDEAFIADSCDAGLDDVGPDRCDGYRLFRVNVTSGQLTAVGPTSEGFGLSGLTFVPEFVPLDPTPELRVVGPVGEVFNGQAGVFQFDVNSFGGGTGHTYEIHNDGNLNQLILSGVTLPTGFATTLSGFPLTIEPGQSRTLGISSVGPTQGVYEGNVILATDDVDEASFSFPIRALYDMPEIVVGGGLFGATELVNGGTLDLGSMRLGETRSTSLRVTNLHAGTLTVTGLTLPAGYAISPSSQALPFSIGRNQSRDLVINRISTTAGTFSGTLTIENNDYDEGPFTLQLTGTVLDESILFFGFSTFMNEGGSINAAAIGSGAIQYTWDLDDDGEYDDATGDTVNLPDTDGPDSFFAKVRMTDNLTTMFRSGNVPVNNVAPFVSFPTVNSVVAGDVFSLDVEASDASADEAAGVTWRIDWGDGVVETSAAGQPVSTSLSHIYSQLGRAEIVIEATDKDGDTGQRVVETWVFSSVIGVFDGPDTSGPELRSGQDSLSFRTAAGGTQDRTLTILNRSASPATVGPVTLPSGYSLVSPPVFPLTVSAGASVPLVVRFAPPAGGDYDGTLSLVTSDGALPVFEVALSGFADAPDLQVSENSGERFNFESGEESFQVQPGTGDFQGLKISLESRNSSAPVLIHNIIPPAGFRVFNAPAYPFNMASESSRNIWIQCEEISTGFYEGWVTILSNDSQKSPFQFYVTSRVGSVADLRVSSMTNDSDSARGLIVNGETGSQTLPLQLFLRNQGDLPLTVSAVSLPTGFGFASPPSLPVTLNIFGSTILPEIVLTATEPGTYSGQVVITSTDPDENPFSFTISETIPGGGGPTLSVSSPVIRAAGPGVLAGVSGTIVGGAANGTAFLEASVDLGQIDVWRVIATIPLDENGEAVFGDPLPVEDPQSLGSDTWFFRIRQ